MLKRISNLGLSPLGLLIWGLAAVFFLYEFFLRTLVGSIAHQIIPDLHLNVETFAIIGSAYYVTYGIMQLPVGILVDRYGTKFILTFATLVCAGSTLLLAKSDGFGSALIARLLMGFGSSFAFVCLLVIVFTWFPKKIRATLLGISQFIGTMGPLLAGGPLIALMSKYGGNWRVTLNQIGLFGIGLAAIILIFVKSKPRSNKEALIFLKRDKPLKERMKKLIKTKQAWAIALYSGANYISLALLGAIWGTKYLQVHGLSQHIAADIVSIAWLGYALGCLSLGVISDYIKQRKPILIFCAFLGFCSTLGITFAGNIQHAWVYGFLFFSLGLAAAGQSIGYAAIAEQVDISLRTISLGFNNAATTIFSSFIPPLVSYFIFKAAGHQSDNLAPEHFIYGFALMPILYIIAFGLSYFCISETFCKPQKETIVLDYKPNVYAI